MKLRKTEKTILFLVLCSFVLGLGLYYFLPTRMASHWNFEGQADGYANRFVGAFILPIVSVGLLVLFFLIPRMDPKRENIEKFIVYFDGLIALIFLFLFYLYVLSIIWNLGYHFNMSRAITPAFAILFYYLGILLSKAEMNWSVGIRTPWTLSDEGVWKRIHLLGSKLFKISGFIALLGVIFPYYAFLFILVPVLIFSFYLVAYSYFLYRQKRKF